MKKLFKLLFLVIILAAIMGIVASIVSKKKFASMSDEEIRAFLAAKLEGKVAEEQLGSIQDAVVAAVRSKAGAATDHYVEEVQEAVEELTEVADEIIDDEVSAKDVGAKAAEIIDAVAGGEED